MDTRIALEDWFIFRESAETDYLREILREIRWKSTNDPLFESLGLKGRGSLVRVLEESPITCDDDCGCSESRSWYETKRHFPSAPGKWISQRLAFRFELDRGRRGLGHQYMVTVYESGQVSVSPPGVSESAAGVFAEDLNDLQPESLLEVIRDWAVAEVMDL